MTAPLEKQVSEGFAHLKTQLDEKLDPIKARLKEHDAMIVDLAQSGHIYSAAANDPHYSKGAVQQAMKSESLAALRAGKVKSAVIPLSGMAIKGITGDGTGTTPYAVTPSRPADAVVGASRRRLRLLDVIQRLPVESGSFEFQQLGATYSNAAGIQAGEETALATQAMPTTPKTATIATIGAILPTSEQVVADTPALTLFLNAQMNYAVSEKLESELIGGTGSISGLLTQATAFTATVGAKMADAVGEAMAQLDLNGWEAGLIILHPNDWQAVRSERTAGGEYVANGWAGQPDGPSIFGCPVIASGSVTEGTAIVLDPTQVILLDRMNPSFEIGRTGDDFANVTYTCRGLVRAGLAVMAASSVLKVTPA